MNQLTVINHEGKHVVDSREVAEMTGKGHAHLMRDIKVYAEYLDNGENPNLDSLNFFIPSTYKTEGNSKEYPCYLLTRKGCDMVANKMTGEKGVLFTAAYVTKFEEMERKLTINPFAGISPELQSILMLDKKQQQIESRVDKLENTMTIDYAQQEELRSMANAVVIRELGGKTSLAYRMVGSQAFHEIWSEYKSKFQVNSYKNTATKDYDRAKEFIQTWKPEKKLALMIKGANTGTPQEEERKLHLV